jgi:Receptor family ligand binding region
MPRPSHRVVASLLALAIATADVSSKRTFENLEKIRERRVLVDQDAPNFFDLMRQSVDVVVESDLQISPIFLVTQDNTTFRLAELKTFLPFSNGTDLSNLDTYNDAFVAMLAVWHFNNVNKSLLLTQEDLAGCDVRMTMELFDTQSSPIETTRVFTNVLRRPRSYVEPPTAGVIGAFRSSESLPLAILTGINSIPQISWSSTAVDFDSKEQFPFFGRTVMSTTGEAAVALSLFQQLGSSHIAIIYVTVSADVDAQLLVE